MRRASQVLEEARRKARFLELHPQSKRTALRRRYKAAVAIRQALLHRLKVNLDPWNKLVDMHKALDEVPELDKIHDLYISGAQYYRLSKRTRARNAKLFLVRDLIEEIGRCATQLDKFDNGKLLSGLAIPSVPMLMSEIEAIEKCFTTIHVAPGLFGVTTDSISLAHDGNEFEFGAFRIVLSLNDYSNGAPSPFNVASPDPRRPDHCSHIHPHVGVSGGLCEGNAELPIKNALNEGRIYDFFNIVYNTLNSYNLESPYVELEAWLNSHFKSCEGCGDRARTDYCAQCGNEFCENCRRFCGLGDRYLCVSCTQSAEDGCDECENLGGAGCYVHQNDECEICDRTPIDSERTTCAQGSEFHTDCLSILRTTDDLPDCCSSCSDREDCYELPECVRIDEEEEEEEEEDEDEDDTDDSDATDDEDAAVAPAEAAGAVEAADSDAAADAEEAPLTASG